MNTKKERPLVSFDWAMKNMLRDKANYDILEGFLSVLLKEDITVLSILESEGNQAYENDKFNRVDLIVENQFKELIVIEVQNNRVLHYLERLLYGSSKLVVNHVQLGQGYKKVKKVISISILYFPLGENASDYVYRGATEFFGLNDHSRLQFRNHTRQVMIGEPPEVRKNGNIFPEYYLIELKRFRDVVQSDLDEWIYFFKNDEVKKEFKSKNIQKVREKLDLLRMPEKERKAYERYLMNRANEEGVLESAKLDGEKKGEKKGKKEGLEEGMKEGKKAGIKEGKKAGMKEGKKAGIKEGKKAGMKEGKKAGINEGKMAIATTLLDRGVKMAEVAEITGLSAKELSKLQQIEYEKNK